MLNAKYTARLLSRVEQRGPDECWPWLGRLVGRPTHKYGHFSVGRAELKAHRLVYEHFVGPIPEGKLLRHSCDHTWCVNPKHLLPGTPLLNALDRTERGRGGSTPGSAHSGAKLTEAQVKEIFALPKEVQNRAAAKKYGVDETTISRIRRGTGWASLTGGKTAP